MRYNHFEMKSVKTFIFDHYEFDENQRRADFFYKTSEGHTFHEWLQFDLDVAENYSQPALDEALRLYWLLAGVSYYKAHLAPEIEVSGLSQWQARTLSHLYKHGLGEFLYINQLNPNDVAEFAADKEVLPRQTASISSSSAGSLVAIGGGKDSLVSVELLKESGKAFSTFRINSKEWVDQQLDLIGVPQVHVTRTFDSFLTSDEAQLKGHVPVTLMVSAAAIIAAIIGGYGEVILSNESSADEPTIADYKGMEINHQYAKSSEAEELMQTWIRDYIASDLKYYSLLREYSELDIARLFAEKAFDKYRGKWSSSNTNFRHDATGKLDWDLESPKTCTVFALLAPYIEKQTLIEEFGGNPFEREQNREIWSKLTGKTPGKPFECVATVEEMNQSLEAAYNSGKWPEIEPLL